jgi:hypothetical protein
MLLDGELESLLPVDEDRCGATFSFLTVFFEAVLRRNDEEVDDRKGHGLSRPPGLATDRCRADFA